MPDIAALSRYKTTGLPSGAEDNEINPQQLTQFPLPAKFNGANGPKQAEYWVK